MIERQLSNQRLLAKNRRIFNKQYPDTNLNTLRKTTVMPELRHKNSLNKRNQQRNFFQQHKQEYQTGRKQKRIDFEYSPQIQQLRRIVYQCEHCRSKLPDFITTKYQEQQTTNQDKNTQTQHDTTLFLMLEAKIEEINRYLKVQIRQIKKRDELIKSKDEELDQIQERFTSVVFKVGQDIFKYQRLREELAWFKKTIQIQTELPAFIKGLMADETCFNSDTTKY